MQIKLNMSADEVNGHMSWVKQELEHMGVPLTGFYVATRETDPGIEIDSKYILQYCYYSSPLYFLDKVESPGEEIFACNDLNEVVQFLRERH